MPPKRPPRWGSNHEGCDVVCGSLLFCTTFWVVFEEGKLLGFNMSGQPGLAVDLMSTPYPLPIESPGLAVIVVSLAPLSWPCDVAFAVIVGSCTVGVTTRPRGGSTSKGAPQYAYWAGNNEDQTRRCITIRGRYESSVMVAQCVCWPQQSSLRAS